MWMKSAFENSVDCLKSISFISCVIRKPRGGKLWNMLWRRVNLAWQPTLKSHISKSFFHWLVNECISREWSGTGTNPGMSQVKGWWTLLHLPAAHKGQFVLLLPLVIHQLFSSRLIVSPPDGWAAPLLLLSRSVKCQWRCSREDRDHTAAFI